MHTHTPQTRWKTHIQIRTKIIPATQYATGDQWRNNSRKNEGMELKQRQYPSVDVTGDRSKVGCCKELYCIGTWNVRSMNQGKLEVAKRDGKSERRYSRNQQTKMDWIG